MRKYAGWPPLRTALEATALSVPEESGRTGAMTAIGVTGPRVVAVVRGCLIVAPIAIPGAVAVVQRSC
jgi:hypothetical protein